MSVWHSPTPAIFTRTSPGPGVGTGTSWYSGGRSHSIIRNAVIVAIEPSSQSHLGRSGLVRFRALRVVRSAFRSYWVAS